MNNDYKTKIIQFAKTRTRKKGVFDSEYFISGLDDLLQKNNFNKIQILKLIPFLINFENTTENEIGLALLQWAKETNNEIDDSLINLLKKTNYFEQIFTEIIYLIWKFKIQKALFILVEKYQQFKNNCISDIVQKHHCLSLMAETIYILNPKKGLPFILDVIKMDYEMPLKNSFYSTTAIVISNLLDKEKISFIDPILENFEHCSNELKKYFKKECLISIDRTQLIEEEKVWNKNYIKNKIDS